MEIREYISSGIVEAFVLGFASEAEIAEVVQLRVQYPELDKAIIDFEMALEAQHLNNAVAPPPNIKANLFAALEDSFVEPSAEKESIKIIPIASQEPILAEESKVVSIKQPKWISYVAAASVILFLGNAIYSYSLYKDYQKLKQDFAALQQENTQEKLKFNSLYADVFRMQDTKMQMVKMKGVPGKEESLATVYWDTESKEVYLFKNKLPEAAKGKQYQLWAIVDGTPVDAGVIDPNCEGFCKLKNIDKPQAFAITLEKEGGSATPTLSEMYVMGGI